MVGTKRMMCNRYPVAPDLTQDTHRYLRYPGLCQSLPRNHSPLANNEQRANNGCESTQRPWRPGGHFVEQLACLDQQEPDTV